MQYMQLHSYSDCFKWFYDWNYSLVLKSCALRHLNVLSLCLQYRPLRRAVTWPVTYETSPPSFLKTPRIRAFRTTRFKSTTFLNSEHILVQCTYCACCLYYIELLWRLQACPGRFSRCKTSVTVVAQLYARHFALCSTSFETACPFWNSVPV